MITLSIIIVSYNVKYYLEQCLRSVFAAAGHGTDYEVLVVDNASPDDTVSYLHNRFPKKDFPTLCLIPNSRNVGFGKANNLAVNKAHGKYVLFLNPDTLLTEHTLKDCLSYAEAHPELGGLGTMMLHDNGRFAYESRRGMPTPWVAFCKMTGLNALFPYHRRLGKYYMRYLNKDEANEIEIMSGAFLMTRREVIDRVGVFDEDFFMYGEDIDLSYRFLQAGYKNYYMPSPILHYKGESTKKNTFKYVHVFYNAMLIFFKKHFHSYWLGFSIPIKLAIVLSALCALVKQQLRMLKRFLLPAKQQPEIKMLYLGQHVEDMKRLAVEWCLNVKCVLISEKETSEVRLLQELNGGGYTNVIFDTADFTYHTMLKALKDSEHKSYLGVYHSQEKILVTGAKVYYAQNVME